MKFTELRDYDSSLELITPTQWSNEILGISEVLGPLDGHLLFISNKKYLDKFLPINADKNLKRSGLILERKFIDKIKDSEEWSQLVAGLGFIASCDNLPLAMSAISKPYHDLRYNELNYGEDMKSGPDIDSSASLSRSAFIGHGCKIHKNVVIHANVTVMPHCEIGEGTEIFPNTTIYPFSVIGRNCRIHANVVIGADGFGYNFDKGIHHKVWHIGGVEIGNDVEIGANSAVDRATFGKTIIGDGCKIDNLVQIGHNVQLGKGVILCGMVAVGGSTIIGDYCVFGGKSAIGDNFKLGNGCQVAGGGLVNCDWPDGSVLGGHPARPLKEWMRGVAYIRKESLKK